MTSEPEDAVSRKRSPKQVRKPSAKSASQPTSPGAIGRDKRVPSQINDEPWIWVALPISANSETDDANDKVGKWMVFVPTAKVDRAWGQIQEATLDGRLGDLAKGSNGLPEPVEAKSRRARHLRVYARLHGPGRCRPRAGRATRTRLFPTAVVQD